MLRVYLIKYGFELGSVQHKVVRSAPLTKARDKITIENIQRQSKAII